jgi:hypothetical protein
VIHSINAGNGLTVSNNYTSYPYISPGSQGAGMLRWNSNTNCMEVNDGAVWKQIAMSSPTVELAPDAMSAVKWAEDQMIKERTRQERIQNNPALRKAYEAVQRAEANYDILDKIVGEGERGQVQHHPV